MFNFKKVVILLFVFCNILFADDIKDYEPQKDFDKKLSIAYYQGGDYINYPLVLKSVIKTLSDNGWLKPIDLGNLDNAQAIWDKLANEAQSDYILFKKDAFYNLKWDKLNRQTVANQFIQRLNETKEWDTAAAHIIANEAGCKLIDIKTKKELIYNKISYKNNYFIASRNNLEFKI